MQPDKSGVYDGHIGRIRSQLYHHVKLKPKLDYEAGGLLCGKPDNPAGFYHLVFENLSGWQVLYIPARHRISEQEICRYVHYFNQLPRTGKLPFTIYGRMGI